MKPLISIVWISIVAGSFLLPAFTYAQSLSLSVTPPLFQLAVDRGDIWQSSVKVVNPNDFPITVFTDVVNFVPIGESGNGQFIPILEDELSGLTLAEWIDLPPGPYNIPAGLSREIPFIIDIPGEASPGGHFGAILVSTQPPENASERVALVTSQAVSSLFFLRIEGDVIEAGDIREFSVNQSIVSVPEAEFLLRFENKGNVHIQPQGDIVIRNMWGVERGRIPINQASRFGNVLPESVRAYDFSWRGDLSFTDFGRFTADVTLTFGDTNKQNVDSSVVFWVIPIKPLLITLGSLLSFVVFVVWVVRLYVRRMMRLAGVDVRTMRQVGVERATISGGDVEITSYQRVTAPISAGVHDLKDKLSGAERISEFAKGLLAFVLQYRLFFFVVLVLLSILLVVILFFVNATAEQTTYEVTIGTGDQQEVINSETLIKEDLSSADAPINTNQEFSLEVINASGRAGTAAELAITLEELGYRVDAVTADIGMERSSTVIIFQTAFQAEAEALSSTLGGALLSAAPEDASERSDIIIYVGRK